MKQPTKAEVIGMTLETAIRKLRHAANRLIPDSCDRFDHRVSIAFGCGTDDLSSRVQAGVICQNLANNLQETLDN